MSAAPPSAQTKANPRVAGRKAALIAKAQRARAAERDAATYGPGGSHHGSQAGRVASIDEILTRLRAVAAR